ncbi:unnamed protein product, partial [Laminaria digitata]
IKNAKGIFSKDAPWDTATEYYFECVYKNDVKLTVSSKDRMGVKFEGTDGWIWVTRGRWEASDPALLESEIGPDEIHLYKSENHFRNFIDCVISREEPVAPIETAHRSITIAHLGNIAMLVDRDLEWNPETEQIIGDEEANRMLSRPVREPWNLI